MSEYVYVAIIQEPMASLDGGGTQVGVFLSEVSAQKWVDNILADYGEDPHDDCKVNWSIERHTVM